MAAARPDTTIEAASAERAKRLPFLQIPRLAASLVERDRLTRRLDRLAALTVLHALSGFGKTTLVGAWAREQQSRGTTVLWMTATTAHESGGAFAAMLREVEARRQAGVALIVVIDDAHHLTDDRVMDDLCALLDQDLMLHIVVISRIRPPFIAVAEARRIEIDVLSARDLAADPREFIQFAQAWGHALNEDEARVLHGLVGGWLAPAKLILDGRRRGDEITLDDRARRFIRATVLPKTGDISPLLHAGRLAIAETITRQRAELLLGSKAASTHEVIDWLESAGLLEPMKTDSSMTWEFHAPIRRELVESFESRYPNEAKALHRELAAHFAEQGVTQSLGMALMHARRGEDWGLLSRLYSQHSLQLTFDFPAAAIAAYSQISGGVLEEFPSLAIPAAIVNSLMSHPHDEERSGLIRAYAEAGQRRLNQQGSTMSVEDAVGAATATLIRLRSDGLLREALELALRVESELITRRARGESEPVSAQLAWFLMQWSMTCLLAGHDVRAAELSARAVGASIGIETEFIATNAAAQLALIHTLNGDRVQGDRWLAQCDRYTNTDQWVAHLIMLPARIARVHRALDRLDEDAAYTELALTGDPGQPIEMWAFLAKAMVEHALLFGEPMVALARLKTLAAGHPEAMNTDNAARRIVDRCTADLLLALGELHRAQRYLSAVESDGPWLAVPRARLQLIAGNPVGARDLAGSGAWRTGTSPRDRIDLLLIAATADLARGRRRDAVKEFTRARELAETSHTILPYAFVPARARDSLFELSGTSLPLEASVLLATIRSVYPETGELIALTSREEVVLQQMFLHNTIPVIAEALTLSVNTIKKQTVSIYGKLGVSDRASALARAHLLGLLAHQ